MTIWSWKSHTTIDECKSCCQILNDYSYVPRFWIVNANFSVTGLVHVWKQYRIPHVGIYLSHKSDKMSWNDLHSNQEVLSDHIISFNALLQSPDLCHLYFNAPAIKWPGHIVLPLSVIPSFHPSIIPSFRIQFPLIISVIHGDFRMKFAT